MEKTIERLYQEARQGALTEQEYLQAVLANYAVGLNLRTWERHEASEAYKYDTLNVEVVFDEGEVSHLYFAAFDLTDGRFNNGYVLCWNTETDETIRHENY